jgi:hypothetical protein
VSLLLCVISISAKAYEYSLPLNGSSYFIFSTVRLLNVNRESTIPAWYSSGLLLAAAGLLAVIGAARRRSDAPYARHWQALGLIFLYLSLDEAAEIHELFTRPMQDTGVNGPLLFGWVIFGMVFALVVGLLYLRFVLALPRTTRNLVILAGVCYIGGALGVEMIGANQWYIDDGTSLRYSAIGTVEEFMEMLGVSLFIYALLGFLSAYCGDIHVAIRTKKSGDHPGPPG